jgi:diketogulonate reductase-like aldo/keto reductase
LNNGSKMPVIIFGTYGLKTPEAMETMRRSIEEVGYRGVDTSIESKNEEMIGDVLEGIFKKGKVTRKEMFIMSKLWCDETGDIEGALKRCLKRLKLDYLDCYIVNWPVSFTGDSKKPTFTRTPMHIQWRQMEECVKMGLTKSIGVSNFNFQLLNDLLTYAEIRPVCNQIELHPYLPQTCFMEWMKSQKIVPISYNTLGGSMKMVSKTESPLCDPAIMKIAESHKKDPAQICIAWGLARGCCVTVKSCQVDHSKSNFESMQLKLTEEEKKMMSQMKKCCRVTEPSKTAKSSIAMSTTTRRKSKRSSSVTSNITVFCSNQ